MGPGTGARPWPAVRCPATRRRPPARPRGSSSPTTSTIGATAEPAIAPMRTVPRPRSEASQPTTKSAGAARPSMVKVDGPGAADGAASDRRGRRGRQGPGSADGGLVVGARRGQRSGSGSCAAAFRLVLPWAATGVRVVERTWAGVLPGVAMRPVASRRVVGDSMAAAGISRRSKSLPHQAHSDQSMPTSRLQFGQTRFSRVRQVGQMIHSSLMRRSQPGQWWIASTSARSASSARFRSQTSPIFSCGRTIL